MNDLEVDYASLRSAHDAVAGAGQTLGRCAVPQLAAGVGTYGFPVLAQAAATFQASMAERVADLGRDCTQVSRSLEAAQDAYRVTDDDAAEGLRRLATARLTPVRRPL